MRGSHARWRLPGRPPSLRRSPPPRPRLSQSNHVAAAQPLDDMGGMERTVAVWVGLKEPVAVALRVGIAEQQHGIPWQDAGLRRLREDTDVLGQVSVQAQRDVTQTDKRASRFGA